MKPKNMLMDTMKSGRTALGVWANDPETAELCAHLGFDWIMIDMMFTGMDFHDVQNMIRTCEAAGITPVVRMQTNPWHGYDARIGVDLSRLQGLGAEYVLISHSGLQEINEALEIARDWHRRALWIHPFNSREWEQRTDEMAQATYIIPHVESQGGIDDFDKVLDHPDLKMFFFAMTDLSKVLGGNAKKPDFNSPDLWKLVDRGVKKAQQRGIMVGANTSYAYTLEEMRQRVKRLHDAGMNFIMIQGAQFLFQVAMMEFLPNVRKDLGLV
ncbi:aldolase/citrate lyase family protein [Paraburkholderia dipogonis]|uniref:Aldolase/citrate lyase family protein n=1 Tax=Paraburkholderia dipogonis TaxID=1211383 RepID=A0ABW9ALB4_9BURK